MVDKNLINADLINANNVKDLIKQIELSLQNNSGLEAQLKAVYDAYGTSTEMASLYGRELSKILKPLLSKRNHRSHS